MKVLMAFLIVFGLPVISYSQDDTVKQVIGKSYTKTGSLYSTTVIFHRNRQAIVTLVTGGDSLQHIFRSIERERKKLGNDVLATYHRLTYNIPGTNKEIEIDVSPYNQDTTPKSNVRPEIDKLKALNFISGNIYFSGTGFTSVASAKASEKTKLETYYLRCLPGTLITLENCIHKQPDGSLSQPANRSIKLN